MNEQEEARRAQMNFGSISHGTMRNEDLINRFADFIEENFPEAGKSLVDEAREITDYDSEQADFFLEDLFFFLNLVAAPGYYFGAHPGDGADYGFWQEEG